MKNLDLNCKTSMAFGKVEYGFQYFGFHLESLLFYLYMLNAYWRGWVSFVVWLWDL
jgi:hypothetical protein